MTLKTPKIGMKRLSEIIRSLNAEPAFVDKYIAHNDIIGKGSHCIVIRVESKYCPGLELCGKLDINQRDSVLRLESRTLQTFAKEGRVVNVYDYFEFSLHNTNKKKSNPKFAILVLENCGTTLRKWINLQSTLIEDRLMAALDIISAIKEVHESKYIHQDINMDNICINDNGVLKIIDMGLSSIIRVKRSEYSAYEDSKHMKVLPDVIGTFPYLNLASCERVPQSYGDDMESIVLLLWHLMDDTSFPWRGNMVNISNHITTLKTLVSSSDTPDFVNRNIKSCRTLPFEGLPNYDEISLSLIEWYKSAFSMNDMSSTMDETCGQIMRRLRKTSNVKLHRHTSGHTLKSIHGDTKESKDIDHQQNSKVGEKAYIQGVLKCLVPTKRGPRWMPPSNNPHSKTYKYCGPPTTWRAPVHTHNVNNSEHWLDKPLPPSGSINGVFPGLSREDERNLHANNIRIIDDIFQLYFKNKTNLKSSLINMGVDREHALVCADAVEQRITARFQG